ncbi:MAG: hypothetical protein HN576_06805 [Bacteriovoracaceae bacterium]|jgi:hypothetical protein|nr:hypothetical protein [Bacteriovoracaceae bacterium]
MLKNKLKEKFDIDLENISEMGRNDNQGLIDIFLTIITSRSEIGKSGFPIIEPRGYESFLQNIPHLFKNGQVILNLIKIIRDRIEDIQEISRNECQSVIRVLEILNRVILTSSVTAPPDLWVIRHLISSMMNSTLKNYVSNENWFNLNDIAKIEKLDLNQLKYMFGFLFSRGYLRHKKEGSSNLYFFSDLEFLNSCNALAPNLPQNVIPSFVNALSKEEDLNKIESFLKIDLNLSKSKTWIATWNEVEVGFRFLPFVLALRYLDKNRELICGSNILAHELKLTPSMLTLCKLAGAINENNEVTLLGERMFLRGPGPYGIIHAYYPYMEKHLQLLQKNKQKMWVARGENVAASQDANARSFQKINQAIDQFCNDFNYKFNVFIEHAVGYGEATRQRLILSGEKEIQYFGADLEQSAIEKAMEGKEQGKLPQNMKFIGNADIGSPNVLIQGILEAGFNTQNAMMVVGNGFHEVRNQTNDKMVNIFKEYSKSGIIIAFTEESGLRDEDLLLTGWNTYHAGFKFMHNISGQGLRPALDIHDSKDENPQFSWKKCAELGNYRVLNEYTNRTRSIFPYKGKNGYNPSISVNYFCVPVSLKF